MSAAIFLLLPLVLAAGCLPESGMNGEDIAGRTAPLVSVCVSIPPQAFAVERIGGERVEIEVLVGPGQSPATYDPTPAQMVALDRADLYFRIGVAFENALMVRIERTMPDLQIVDLREGITLLRLPDHQHGGGGHDNCAHGAMDPHTWLNPGLMAVQARTIADSLTRHDPEGADIYAVNLSLLEADLERVDEEIGEILAPVRGGQMFVFHPAFGYFAEAYGLEQVAIEIEGKEPSSQQLGSIIAQGREQRVKAIFVQPEFSTAAATAVAREVGAEVVSIDPLARDYLHNLTEMARKVREALEDE